MKRLWLLTGESVTGRGTFTAVFDTREAADYAYERVEYASVSATGKESIYHPFEITDDRDHLYRGNVVNYLFILSDLETTLTARKELKEAEDEFKGKGSVGFTAS